MLAEFVWDAAVLEGNPFTYPQVKTLLDGVTVGGHRLSDQDQVIRLAVSCTELYNLVRGIPAARAREFNEKMIQFHTEKDATGMMAFLIDCHPEAEAIRRS